jgi:hypothetical protein
MTEVPPNKKNNLSGICMIKKENFDSSTFTRKKIGE